MLGPAADDDAVALLGSVLHDLLGDLQDTFAIHQVKFVRVNAALAYGGSSTKRRTRNQVISPTGRLMKKIQRQE